MKNYGFTLAEVLITLAIIGVVAAVSIPSVISNSQQQEFKTGLRKAVSVLNSAITMNMALDGETPYDNINTFAYLQRHMSILKSTLDRSTIFYTVNKGGYMNAAFYTTDGMRFEVRNGTAQFNSHPLYENPALFLCTTSLVSARPDENGTNKGCMGCGSFGLNNNPDNTTKVPCLITVDVNGDRKPNPSNVNCKDLSCAKELKAADPNAKKLTDIFSLMITDREVIPYGMAAQKAMYNSRN
ncbi:MAG: type II secretion system protein [bacterium]|nr:type II secretion system protein [bacterium]